MAVGQAGADQLLQDSLGDGHHHGRGGRVAEPHGEEDRAAHEAEHQPEKTGRNFMETNAQMVYKSCLALPLYIFTVF